MGSTSPKRSPAAPLPSASSPSLILTQPTAAERSRIWTLTHPMWGPALTLDGYLSREAYLTTVPLAKEGGVTHWILTDGSQPPDARPLLSSCETLRKRALSACAPTSTPADVTVVDGIAHGLGSVFTDEQYRGRGYASRMMQELGTRLRTWQVATTNHNAPYSPSPSPPHALFSVLYSDIGKTFYARSGWAPFASSHVEFAPAPTEPPAQNESSVAKPIGYHELAELCSVDAQLLRATLARRAVTHPGTACVALLPDLDAMLWHLMREDFMTTHIFGRTPAVKGAVAGAVGRRVWAVWTRGYYGGLDKVEGNTLHILRVVVEDEDMAVEGELAHGFSEIIRIAQAEAAAWRSADVQMWNPTDKVSALVEACGIAHRVVVRDQSSIASLMWYGEGETAELDWVANEKYGWC
ncbi:hypothetical protein B0T22DRAFT_457136 [Podospora appendiculata]|uniref:LYC1 C-terminal domain-containing protein n=1 Tax=Podospora appendiculata TaxID=314037 RepID=A0AAE0X7E3_9PEZI|nr:hypothetical protein B0T22DRAFT_457136 [Podospora appendiculata]